MKIYKYTILTFILFLLGISNIHASCTQEEINNFKKVEDQYKVTYEIDKTTKTYKVTFFTPAIDKYTYTIDEKIETNTFDSVSDESIAISGIKPGEYQINVIGVTEECDEILKKIALKLPKYNHMADDPLCKGIEEFVLCNPLYDKEIDYESFVSRVETYKANKNKTQLDDVGEEKDKIENENLNRMIKYLKENLIQIIIIVVFVILLIITIAVTAKSIRKSRRLE